ncbi:MAG: D-hexose-6-phosphate mutarotase [Pseudomonadota bacterium]
MSDVSGLNSRFGIADQLVFNEIPGGLIVAEITNKLAAARIALQGAHVLTWAPKGHKPVIWLSEAAKFAPGKSIRGGAPVCWPWFGAHPEQSSFPAHGYARTVPWEIIDARALGNGATSIALRLKESDATRAFWPHATPIECHITVGTDLEIELITRNQGSAPVTVGEALHTYFAVSDIREVQILGLADCTYFDKVDNGARKKQAGAVSFSGETDRVYLNTAADCLIVDPTLRRRIRIAKRGSQSTVVWNPWVEKAEKMGDLGQNGYLKMVCVESANALDNVVSLPAGQEHRLWVSYSVEPQS